MKITLQQNALAEVLGAVVKARGDLLLDAIRLDFEANRLSLTCFNGVMSAAGSLAAQSDGLTETAYVSASKLHEVVQTLDGEMALDTSDPSDVLLTCGNFRSKLRRAAAEFPRQDNLDVVNVQVAGMHFRQLLAATEFASKENSRPALQTVHLKIVDQLLQAQTTDGYSMCRLSAPATGNGDLDKLLPADFIRTLAKVIQDKDHVEIGQTPSGLILLRISGESRSLAFVSPPADPTSFPDQQLDEIIQKAAGNPVAVNISAAELLRIVRQVKAVGGTNVHLKGLSGQVLAASEDTAFGQARNTLAASKPDGEFFISIAAGYLEKALKACDSDPLMKVDRPQSAVYFSAPGAVVVVMPLAVSNDPFEQETPATEAAIPVEMSVPIADAVVV